MKTVQFSLNRSAISAQTRTKTANCAVFPTQELKSAISALWATILLMMGSVKSASKIWKDVLSAMLVLLVRFV